jgi:hypothetical protein
MLGALYTDITNPSHKTIDESTTSESTRPLFIVFFTFSPSVPSGSEEPFREEHQDVQGGFSGLGSQAMG